MAFYALMCR